MKAVFGLFAALCLAGLMSLGAESSVGQFRAGAHEVDISPTNFPVIVNAMFTERSATKVVDRLLAKALVLEDNQTRLAICVVDTCMMPRDLIDRAKDLAAQGTGIPAERMLVSATHTHSAPAAMGCLGSRVDPGYAAMLPGKVAEAIIGAAKKLVPVQIGWASVDDWQHTFNRRWVRRPDRMLSDPFGVVNVRAHMHPGHESPDAVGPSGPVDPGLTVLAVRHPNGRPLAVLANYSQHYYESALLSSDYYGRFASHLAQLLDAPVVGIMSQGTSGDLMWMDYGSPRKMIGYDTYAREVAQEAYKAYQQIRWHDAAPLRMAERRIILRYRTPSGERLVWAREMKEKLGERLPQSLPEIYALEAIYLHEQPETDLKLQAIKIGDLGITAIPNEVYAITGLKIKAQSPFPVTCNIELANGAEGYIPSPEQHRLGGYTTWPARTAGLETNAEPRIVETLLELLEEVSGKPRRPLLDEPGAYTRAVLASSPAAFWRLNEIVAATALDASGKAKHATVEDGVAFYLAGVGSGTGRLPNPELRPSAFSGGQINRALHFAGGRMRATVSLGTNYTVELWFWNGLPDNARAVTGYVFSAGKDGDPHAGEHLGIAGTALPGSEGRLIVFNGNRRNGILTGRTRLELRQWYHVVLVREGERALVYLNDVLEAEGTVERTLPPGQTEVFCGGRCDNFANFEGRLDEVAFYDRALSPKEIAVHWRAGNKPL